MKVNGKSILSLVAGLLCLALFQGQSLAGELKIGTISIQNVLDNSVSGKAARKVMEAKQSELQPKFQKEQEKLKALAKEIEKKGSVWSPEVKADREREYQKMMREYQLKVEDAQYELKQLEKNVLDPIFKTLQGIISEVSKKEGMSLVLEKSKSSGLVYADPALDLSEKITKALDAKLDALKK